MYAAAILASRGIRGCVATALNVGGCRTRFVVVKGIRIKERRAGSSQRATMLTSRMDLDGGGWKQGIITERHSVSERSRHPSGTHLSFSLFSKFQTKPLLLFPSSVLHRHSHIHKQSSRRRSHHTLSELGSALAAAFSRTPVACIPARRSTSTALNSAECWPLPPLSLGERFVDAPHSSKW